MNCNRCEGITKKGLRCKLKASCRIGCQIFCFRHAFRYVKPPGAIKGVCTDRKPKTSKQFCGGARDSARIGHGVEVKQSTISGGGMGLFATRHFEKGDAVTEYDGHIIDRKTAEHLASIHRDTHIRSLSRHSLIDGLKHPIEGRGGGSFANDLKGHYNVVFCKTEDVIPNFNDPRTGPSDLTRIFLRASRDIQLGEEIFVDYQKGTRERMDI
jgi:hypothetical protein